MSIEAFILTILFGLVMGYLTKRSQQRVVVEDAPKLKPIPPRRRTIANLGIIQFLNEEQGEEINKGDWR